jgi:flagellar hook-associated protein 2
MADLSIPGVTDNLNTQKIVNALMDAERIPLTRMQQEQALEEQKKSAWQTMTRELSALRDDARLLYGFQNPFNEKAANSSNTQILTANAERTAIPETAHITVKRLATADRFLSQPLPKDFRVDAGDYSFRVGDKEVRFTFSGGSLKEFVDALNKRGGDLLSASLVSDSATTQVLLIESKKTGAGNRLVLGDKSTDLALKAGILERSATVSRQIALSEKAVEAWAKPLTPEMYALAEGVLTLNPGGELRIPVHPGASLNPNMVLELSVKTEMIPETQIQEAAPASGPAVPDTGSLQFHGITIQSHNAQAPIAELPQVKPPEKVTDMQVLFMEGGGKLVALPQTVDSADFTRVQIPVGELATSLDALDLRNRNTQRRIVVKDIALFDKTQRGDFVPKKPLSEAGDAVVSLDGIEATRSTNQIDDLIPGVTLHLAGQGDQPVELEIGPDTEAIKKSLVGFLGDYNRVLTDIDILTRKDSAVITDITYLTDAERTAAQKNLGLLMGEISLRQLKDAMQRVMMNPYPTSLGKNLTLLTQIGISTDTRAPGSGTGVDWSRMRGYLEVNEPVLDGAIAQHADAVRELFGSDTNGDLVVNAGAAYALDTLIRPYVMVGGLFPSKVANLDSEIARTKKQITDYQKHLDDYQAQLKQKYGQMQGAVDLLNRTSQDISNFTKQQQNSGQ